MAEAAPARCIAFNSPNKFKETQIFVHVCLHAVKGEVRMAFRTDIMESARSFAELEAEQFATEHLWRAMDSLLPGSCYGERDAMADKFTALETRVPFYLAYDRMMSETGQTGSSDTESARKRISIYDEHVGEISQYVKDEQDRLFMHL